MNYKSYCLMLEKTKLVNCKYKGKDYNKLNFIKEGVKDKLSIFSTFNDNIELKGAVMLLNKINFDKEEVLNYHYNILTSSFILNKVYLSSYDNIIIKSILFILKELNIKELTLKPSIYEELFNYRYYSNSLNRFIEVDKKRTNTLYHDEYNLIKTLKNEGIKIIY